ncbi:MAG: metal ABC transporter ATP-binding protein [Anaerolineales bacterium]
MTKSHATILYHEAEHDHEQPILDVRHLSVRYNGHTALDRLTFHLHAGERVAVVGPNGAGKSTLFKAVAGSLPVSEGEIKIFGSQPSGHVCIGYVPQRNNVDWHFPVSVEDVVMMGRIAKIGLFGWPRPADRQRVQAALETVHLTPLAKRQIAQLSGGQQQRMFIARALAQESELMLMDEPLTGLDAPSQKDLLTLLDELKTQRVTILVATHDLQQAATHFERVMLLNRRIVAFGAPAEVLTSEHLANAYGGGALQLLGDTCCEGEPQP